MQYSQTPNAVAHADNAMPETIGTAKIGIKSSSRTTMGSDCSRGDDQYAKLVIVKMDSWMVLLKPLQLAHVDVSAAGIGVM